MLRYLSTHEPIRETLKRKSLRLGYGRPSMHAARTRRVLRKTLLEAQAYIGPPQGINIADRDRTGRRNAKGHNRNRVVRLNAGKIKVHGNICKGIEDWSSWIGATIPQPWSLTMSC